MIFIQKHIEVYGNTTEMNQFWIIIDYPADTNSVSFKLKENIIFFTTEEGTKDNGITAP